MRESRESKVVDSELAGAMELASVLLSQPNVTAKAMMGPAAFESIDVLIGSVRCDMPCVC